MFPLYFSSASPVNPIDGTLSGLEGKAKNLAECRPTASGQQAGDLAVGVEDVETQDFASLRGAGVIGGDAAGQEKA
jgi:hypothetical protein